MASKIVEKGDPKNNKTRTYGENTVRTIWDPKKNKMLFCVRDVILAVTNIKDPKDYIKKMRKRDVELGEIWDKIVKFLPYKTTGGLQYLMFVDLKGLSYVTKTIRPYMSEPFIKWAEKQQAKAAAK